MTSTPTSTSTFTLTRDGNRDLSFKGWELGTGSHGSGGNGDFACNWDRGTDVAIYRTEGGSFVISVKQWSRWQGEGDLHRAAICDDAESVLNWLIEDCGDVLGPASKEAFENAAVADPEIDAILCEVIG